MHAFTSAYALLLDSFSRVNRLKQQLAMAQSLARDELTLAENASAAALIGGGSAASARGMIIDIVTRNTPPLKRGKWCYVLFPFNFILVPILCGGLLLTAFANVFS